MSAGRDDSVSRLVAALLLPGLGAACQSSGNPRKSRSVAHTAGASGRHRGQQIDEGKRFGKEGPGSGAEAFVPRPGVVPTGGDDDYLTGSGRKETPKDGHPIQLRQLQVEDDHVVGSGEGPPEAVLPVTRLVHLDALGTE